MYVIQVLNRVQLPVSSTYAHHACILVPTILKHTNHRQTITIYIWGIELETIHNLTTIINNFVLLLLFITYNTAYPAYP
jgi:hypothetical protein